MSHNPLTQTQNSLKCDGCGAFVAFEAGTHHLKCPYCGNTQAIEANKDNSRTFKFEDYEATQKTVSRLMVSCHNCGTTVTLPDAVTSDNCPFCASPLVVSMGKHILTQQPDYVIPFAVNSDEAQKKFRHWASKLWFAPSDLIHRINQITTHQLQGVYIPYWCYNTHSASAYSGSRGDYYYVQETHTKVVNGETVTETRSVRHTRWTPVSGYVKLYFENLLVSASPSLPQKTSEILEPWDLTLLVGFDDRYVAGFRSETFRINAKEAFVTAQQRTENAINDAVTEDIGGDEQDIDDIQTKYHSTEIRYLLLPVWLSSYQYNGKLYQLVINACTGEVTGSRPYSATKITLFVLFIIAILVVAFIMIQQNQQHTSYGY